MTSAQFHQHYTEIERRKRMTAGALELCARSLVKLTPDIEEVKADTNVLKQNQK